ncbi:hypothetical protein F4703DRAFT_1936395 [Phycomyces blakesleeanus]
MAPVNTRISRSNARNSLTQVAAGCVEQRPVTSAVTQEQRMAEMSNRLDNMDKFFQQLPRLLLHNFSKGLKQRQRLQLWSNDHAEIAENEARQIWSVDERADYPDRAAVVAYLRHNYGYCHRRANRAPNQRIDKNRKSRITSQIKEVVTKQIHNRLQDIHTRYRKVIDKEMGLTIRENSIAFFGAIQKAVMSDAGEMTGQVIFGDVGKQRQEFSGSSEEKRMLLSQVG